MKLLQVFVLALLGCGTPLATSEDRDADSGSRSDTAVPDVVSETVEVPDAPGVETSPVDVAPLDTGFSDTFTPDVQARDTGSPDASRPDTGFPDTWVPVDTGFPDTGFPDTGFPDTGFPDTGFADTGFPDMGPPPCPGSQVRCSGVCTDLLTTATNCGVCGNACPARPNAPAICEAGICVLRCASGFANCDGNLTNGCESFILMDVTNCGACGNVCPFPAHAALPLCLGGACRFLCQAGYGDCDGIDWNGCEVSFTEMANCGTCGNACPVGGTCSAGRCSCPTGQVVCGGTCVNTASNAANCGTCGHACATGEGCCSGVCTDLTNDLNCGRCAEFGGACAVSSRFRCRFIVSHGYTCTCTDTLCSISSCVILERDPRNCGACGRRCGLCYGRACVTACPSPTTDCSGSCTFLTNDPYNCGACGRICPWNARYCMTGVCRSA